MMNNFYYPIHDSERIFGPITTELELMVASEHIRQVESADEDRNGRLNYLVFEYRDSLEERILDYENGND